MTATLTLPETGRTRAAAQQTPVLPGLRMLTLTLSDQATRRPLDAWSADLAAEMRAVEPPFEMERCRVVIGAANAAALVQTNAGRAADAERVCRAQIAWVQALADRTGQGGLLTLAVQPWINLGRLRGLAGRTDEALQHFREIAGCRVHGTSVVAGRTIESADWTAAGWNLDALERFGRAVLASDSVRVLLAAGRYPDVLAMTEAADVPGDAGDRIGAVLREARLVALGRMGRTADALAHADRWRREAASWDRMILQLRWAELAWLSGEEEAARRALRELVALCGRLPVADSIQLLVLFAIQHLATLALALAPSRDAFELAEAVHAGARRCDDEVMQHEMLRLLADHACAGAERDRWAGELRRLDESTAYARLRKGAACPPAASATVDRLMDATLGVLRAA